MEEEEEVEEGREASDPDMEEFLQGAGCSQYLKLFKDNKVKTVFALSALSFIVICFQGDIRLVA